MAWLKGARTDGYIRIEENVDFRKNVIGVLGMKPKRSENYFVDGKDGSDSNSGKSWEGAFATIEKAVTTVNNRISWSDSPWARGDNIYIAPGAYAENLTAFPYGANVIGLGDSYDLDGENGVVIKPATGAAVDATSIINTNIYNVSFMQVATAGALFQVDNFNRSTIRRALFAGIPGASPTTTRGFEIVKDCTGSYFEDLQFLQVRNGIYVNTDNANSKQISGTIFNRIYMGAVDQTGFYFDANCVPTMVYINNSVIGDGSTTLALGLDDNADGVQVVNTHFRASANDPATGSGRYSGSYLNGTLLT